MKTIRVARSFIASDALAELIANEYACGGNVTCKLFSKMLRTQDNDHYLVRTESGEKYVARVYQLGQHLERQESDYQYELDWLNFLRGRGLPVAHPIRRLDGRFLGSLNAPEGNRYYALFSYAEGEPMSIQNQEHLYSLGANMAQIHIISNEFKSEFQRQPMDLKFLVEKSIARIKHVWDDDPERGDELDILETSGLEAKEEILTLIRNTERAEDSWGPIGGDFHNANTHFDANNNPTFFNFDLCGSGWRAYDIASFLLNTNLVHRSTELSEAFFAGYYSVRQLSRNEHEAIAPFLTIRRIWLTGTFTLADGLAGHTFIASALPG